MDTAAAPLARLQRASLGMCLLLLVQFGLGIWVNLYVTLPQADQGANVGTGIARAVSNGPAVLAVHVIFGLALVLNGLVIALQTLGTRRAALSALSSAGFLSMLGAAISGSTFVGNTKAGSSLGMALAWAVALGCYLGVLFLASLNRD